MKTYRKKCGKCSSGFSSRYRHAKYCKKHRKSEKALRSLPDNPHSCSICNRLLEVCGIGLDKLITDLEESPKKLKEEIDLWKKRYHKSIADPPRYERYIERLSMKMDISKGLFREDIFSIKSLANESGFSVSTVKRHVHQHLIPLKYLKKIGRGFTIDIGIYYSLPRYYMYYKETEVYWSHNIGYFGFRKEDIKLYENELKSIDNELQLILERVIVLSIKTRLERIKRIIVNELIGKDLTTEEKAVKLYGVRLALHPCLQDILSNFAPTLSRSGRDLSMLKECIDEIENIGMGDDDEMKGIIEIANTLHDPHNQLLRKGWVGAFINNVVNAVNNLLSFDVPTIVIDRKIGPRSVVLNESS